MLEVPGDRAEWMRTRRAIRVPLAAAAVLLVLAGLASAFLAGLHAGRSTGVPRGKPTTAALPVSEPAPISPIEVYAHNLLLRKGPAFRVYIVWLRGQMLRTSPARVPSFDDTESFILDIRKGVLRVELADLARFLNAGAMADMPLTHVSLDANGDEITLHGTVHKLVPLPVQLVGVLAVTADNRIHFHVEHLDVLKVPLKGLLGDFGVKLDDLVHSGTPGIAIFGNDVIFNTEVLLPPPHIRGSLTQVGVIHDSQGPAIEAVYGGVKIDPAREQQWHNFLRLADGTLDFGKLTMHHVDLTLIDASKDPWFDLDLTNYQAQLVHGMTRMTPQAGLQIFMPDLDDMPPQKAAQTITMEWLRDRNLPPPSDIPYR